MDKCLTYEEYIVALAETSEEFERYSSPRPTGLPYKERYVFMQAVVNKANQIILENPHFHSLNNTK